MSKKPILTQEQADAVERLKYLWRESHVRSRNLTLIKEKLDPSYEWNGEQTKGANNIPDRDFISLLHYGYEVEPVFEIGQWVKSTEGKGIGKIIKIDDRNYYTDFGLVSSKRDLTIRHATSEEIAEEKERKWWARHGRKVRELRENDEIILNRTTFVFIKVNTLIEQGGPSQTFNLFKKVNGDHNIVHVPADTKFTVKCFAENRLDVKTDE